MVTNNARPSAGMVIYLVWICSLQLNVAIQTKPHNGRSQGRVSVSLIRPRSTRYMYIHNITMMMSSNGNISALLVICAGNSPVTSEFPAQRPLRRIFDVFFDLRLNKRLSKQSWGWWFETPSFSLWHQCNDEGVTKLYSNMMAIIGQWSNILFQETKNHNDSITQNCLR